MAPSRSKAKFVETALLSINGPLSLNYQYPNLKFVIRDHLISLFQNFPTFSPDTEQFTHDDGHTSFLLNAKGTLPITSSLRNLSFSITIWILETYPLFSPLVYLSLDPGVIIRSHHPLVDPSGFVSTYYLLNWAYPSSNLLELVRNLRHVLNIDPPIDAGLTQLQRPCLSLKGTLASEQEAIDRLSIALHHDTKELGRHLESEIDGLMARQEVLRERKFELEKGLKGLEEERNGLEERLSKVLSEVQELEKWVMEHSEKMDELVGGDDFDYGFAVVDGVSKCLLEHRAADSAIEDLLYDFDRGFQEGAVPLAIYLKNVRALSKEQFFHRDMQVKVVGLKSSKLM
ncbi:hypothetical protein AMTRI_Chr03g54640 [Amborella trichopoda]|uniref:UEV domain-containing protein n=1 Tax=Amborella trichopoda TaxID=13333 RepID=W1P3D6_AMBTC|nr:protein ELC-like [Amborella trichopoda]ERN01470.1 hypothetical protein AMTR_s00002p00269040 [Amborella trichopoda]|eukprot:XP_006838901.1 protein ELC-like [Amborella trichopoda]